MKIRPNRHLRWSAITIILLAVFAVTSAFVADRYLPRQIKLNEGIEVNAPPSYLYEEINNLERWPVWGYWFDDGTQVSYGERKTGIDAYCTWSSGKDERTVTILQTKGDEMVRARIDLAGTAPVTYEFQLKTDSLDPSRTHLTMLVELSGEDNSAWARWKRFIRSVSFGSVFDHTLHGLKRIAENKPTFSHGISEELLAPSYYIGIEIPSMPELPLSSKIVNAQKTLFNVLQRAGVHAEGYPFSIAADSTGRTMCCIPVAPDARLPSAYPILQLYSGAAIRAIDSTGYGNVKSAHDEIRRYIRYKDYRPNGSPWEVYQVDASNMNDPSHWITQVYYPVLEPQVR